MRRFTNFIAGAFCGALVGSVVALLLAPYSGMELRKRATDRIDTLRDEMDDAYRTRRAQLEAELQALKDRASG